MTDQSSPNLSERLADALRLVDEAIASASQQLANGPDNPRIQRLSGSVSAFTVKLSDLTTRARMPGERGTGSVNRSSWSVFDHDWLAQYRYARELLEARRFAALRELLAGGGYRDSSHGWRAFAPEVIEHVKAITGDLQTAVSLTDAKRMKDEAPTEGEGPLFVTAEPRQLSGKQLYDGVPRRRPRP
jgi:hypothetical protein